MTSQSGKSDVLPPQQKRAMEYLRGLPEGEWADRVKLAGAVGSTKRGAGNVLSQLMNRGLITCRRIDYKPGDAYCGEWEYRAR